MPPADPAARFHTLVAGVGDLSPQERLVSAFLSIRDIPYGSANSPTPFDVLSRNRGTAKGKHLLLAMVLRALGYEPVVCGRTTPALMQAHAQGMGQFFTPMSVARLMIAITLGDVPRAPKADGSLWTVAEPALGAGGMVLAAMGHIVSSHGTAALGAWGFYGMDLDLLCARMAAAQIVMQCDIQEAPVGELVIWQGNSLTMEHRRLVVHAEHRARATARAPVKLRAAG